MAFLNVKVCIMHQMMVMQYISRHDAEQPCHAGCLFRRIKAPLRSQQKMDMQKQQKNLHVVLKDKVLEGVKIQAIKSTPAKSNPPCGVCCATPIFL